MSKRKLYGKNIFDEEIDFSRCSTRQLESIGNAIDEHAYDEYRELYLYSQSEEDILAEITKNGKINFTK